VWRDIATRFWARIGTLSVVLPAVVVAATALAYYGYRYAQEMASRGVQAIQETNRELATEKIEQVERVLREGAEALFDVVNPSNLQALSASDVVRRSRSVESVVVVNDRGEIAPDGFVSRKRKPDADAFRALLVSRIVKDLALPKLAEGEIRFLHHEYDGRYHLLVVTRRGPLGRPAYIVLETDLAYVVGDLLPELFRNVGRRLYQVVDERGSLVFGHPFTGVPEEYQFTRAFEGTLSAWRLRMAPREAPNLHLKESQRRAYDWFFILLSAFVMFAGLLLIALAVRTERRASELKSDFIANVSHELKTPLSLIRMFAEMLTGGRVRDEAKAKEYAEIIQRESERLTHLIDNVLDFARIERGKVAYTFRTGDLADVVARGLDVYRYRLEREGLKLTVDVAPDLPPVELDENAMTLVLLNLVDNAVKYAPDGKAIEVAVFAKDERVVLSVTDHGPGIDLAEQERIFERFYRSPRVRGKRVRGSGIGLSLVKHIALGHGGGVEVESKPGEGSTFSVWIPTSPEPDVRVSESQG
jgi:two-component system, OmpR family, phosphate regulon sensor histidine kinase PhoR